MKYFIPPLIFLAIGLMVFNCTQSRKALSSDFSATDIQQIQLKMTLQEVEETLGKPFGVSMLYGQHNASCSNPMGFRHEIEKETNIAELLTTTFNDTHFCCSAYRADLQRKRATLEFTKPVLFSKEYPMLWIHIDSLLRVSEVYSKCYGCGSDEKTTYSLSYQGEIVENEFYELFD